MDFKHLSIASAHKGLLNKEFSARELTTYYLEKISRQNKTLNAFISVDEEGALATAEIIDQKIKTKQHLNPLAGIPCGIKDLLLVKDQKATAGSKILADYKAVYDAEVVRRLKAEDAIILGKNNCDEFAMGSSNETSAFGPVKNPWDLERVSGGSSGGSAAAVASDQCLFSIGTDTGGSIRQPASFCGAVGFKPTYGRVSRRGIIAMTSSLDQAGPITRTVEDAAEIFRAISGQDTGDATTVNLPLPDLGDLAKSIRGLKIGLPKEYFNSGADVEAELAIKNAIAIFTKMGAEIKEVSLPRTAYALAVYYILMPAEVSSNLARYDGLRYGHQAETARDLEEIYNLTRGHDFGKEVKRRLLIGTYVLSAGQKDAYYAQARKVQKLIAQDYADIFKEVDVLLSPTTPTSAFKLGEKTADPLTMYLADIYTVAVNIAGLCAISVPAGLTSAGLPLGLQLIGAPFKEEVILRAAYHYQHARSFPNCQFEVD
jgi:aspartyl-tRNA(Asn)/glutamyl-tRNA(Gln) amidotransferase subunit A